MSDDRLISVLSWGAGIVALGFLVYVVYASIAGQRGVYFEDGYLIIDTFAANERLPLNRVDVEDVQIVEFKGSSPLRPQSRISGNSSMKEGLYYLRNGDRAYVSVGGTGPVVYIPAGRKMSVLIRNEDPSDLLCELLDHKQTPNQALHPSLDRWLGC